MIRKTLDGIEYKPEDLTTEHIAICYSFLLNTPDRRGKWFSWSELADLMTSHFDNPTVRLLAQHLKGLDK